MVKQLLIILFPFVLLTGTCPIYSQTTEENKELANQLVEIGQEVLVNTQAMEIARDNFVQAADLDPENIKANWLAGELILKTNNKERSTKYLKRVYELDPDYHFDNLYYIGEGYQYSYDFKQALEYYEKYKRKLENDPNYRGRDKVPLRIVTRKIYECQNGLEYIVNPQNYSIVNVGSAINSEYPDYGPILNADETLMVFTSRRRDGNLNEDVDDDNFPFEDIYTSSKNGDKWSYAENIGEKVNSPFHGSSLALSADGNELFIYSDENEGDIYVTDRESGDWSTPKPLSNNINSSFAEKSVSISTDRNILFFSSDRPGGIGETDLYVSYKDEKKGIWGEAVNLGETINSEMDEEGPFIDYDNKTLYFSSRGRNGMGGYDIFRSEYDSATSSWQEPVNLGYPINTPDDDIYFVSTKDGERGYYASVREDGMGYTDIYMVTIPELSEEEEPVVAAKDPVKEPMTDPVDPIVEQSVEMKPVNLLVKVLDGATGSLINDVTVKLTHGSKRVETPGQMVSEGVYSLKVINDTKDSYMLSLESTGYAFRNLKISLPLSNNKEQIIKRSIDMKRVQQGVRMALRNIYFDFSKATLKDESYNELNKLERMIADNPSSIIEISGHTDRIGTKSFNQQLSLRRAQAVANYLKTKGVPANRLKTVGYGETRPIASNDDELDGRQLNRRVEFKVLK